MRERLSSGKPTEATANEGAGLLTKKEENWLGKKLLEARLMRESIEKRITEKLPVLPEEMERLKDLEEEEEQAKEVLLEKNLGLVFKFSFNTCLNLGCPIRGADFEDMLQEGKLAFWLSLNYWDYRRARVSSYAGESAKRAIYNFSLTVGRSREYSRYFWKSLRVLIEKVAGWEQENGREISSEEIIKILSETVVEGKKLAAKDVNIKERITNVFLGRKDLHLEDPVSGGGEETLLDMLSEGEDFFPVQSEVERNLLRETVREVLDTLPFVERKILELRNGLDGGEPETLAEVGQKLDRGRSRIQQIEGKALERLRHPSRSRFLRDFL